MSSSFTLRFPSKTAVPSGGYKLLELTPELVKIFEGKDATAIQHITIRGQSTDEAVLCTNDKTYALRFVHYSNSFLVCTGRDASEDCTDDQAQDVMLRDSVHEIMEMVPIVPRLDRLDALLRENVYQIDDDEDETMSDGEDDAKKRYTYAQVRNIIQASDMELERGLREKHILELEGYLRPLPSSSLTHILSLILTLIPAHSWKPSAVPYQKLTEELLYTHNVHKDVTSHIARWFGAVVLDKWEMDQLAVVRRVGLGLIESHRHDPPRTEQEILEEWKKKVGDQFEHLTDLSLLTGNYIDTTDPSYQTSQPIEPRYKYFPASDLPTNPVDRFGDLFRTKSRWRAEELTPFLQGVAVDQKERDKMLVIFTRTSTDAKGVKWYSARANH